jgi:uncharacterized membrane protein YidH (DUF202 family)
VRQLAALVPLLGLANGLFALALNYRRWKHPERETPRGARLRRGVSWLFLGLLVVVLVLLLVVVVVSLVRISE